MSEQIVVGGSAKAFFQERVSEALAGRGQRVGEATQVYLVDLLERYMAREQLFTAADGPKLEPLALMLQRALESEGFARRRGLQQLGDTSLFVSGFFSDALARSLVDVDYYIAMGERAYDTLSGEPRVPAGANALFGELARRFPLFVDLFAEIAEQSDLTSNRGLVKLYERFLLTGSERVARRLRERGVALFAGPGRPRYGGSGPAQA